MARRRLVLLVALAVVAAVGLVAWRAPHLLGLSTSPPRADGASTGGELSASTDTTEKESAPTLIGAGRTKERDAPPARPTGADYVPSLTGIVVDGEGNPIAGAAVHAVGKPAREPLARSADDGRFTVSDEKVWMDEGDGLRAYLWARAPGYVGQEQSTDAHPWGSCRIVMTKGAALRVRVLERATKSPVADARVRAIRGDDIGNVDTWRRMVLGIDEATTDAQGRAVLGVPEGTAYARVTAAGFAPNDSVVVMVGAEGAEAEVLLVKGANVRGVVKDREGALVAGATVFLVVGPLVKESATTGPDGRFRFDDVPAADGRDPWEEGAEPLESGLLVRAKGHGKWISPVDLPAAGETRELVVTLGPPRALEGTVVEADGRPIAEVSVYLRFDDPADVSDSDTRSEARSDEAGRFAFEDVPAGPVTLSTSRAGAETPRIPYVRWTVPAEGAVPPVVLRAHAAGVRRTLEAHVVGVDGKPVGQVDARVNRSVYDSDHPHGFYGTGDSAGHVRFTDLPAAILRLRVAAPAHGVLETLVDLTKSDVRDLKLTFPSGTATIRVRRLDGRPARLEVYVMRWRDDTDVSWGEFFTLDQQGSATVRGLSEGEYGLHVHSTGVVLVNGPSRFRPGEAGLTWTAATEAEARGMQTSLVLVDAANGRPLDPTEVRVVEAPEVWCETEQTPGHFLAPPVLPGRYTLVVDVQGHRPSTVEGVELGRAGPVVTVRVPLDPGLSLAGRVVDATGRPIADAGLRVPSGEFRSAADGTFRVTGLAEGPLRIEIQGKHCVETRIDLRIAAPPASRDLVVPVAGVVRVEATRLTARMPRSCNLRLLAVDGTVVRSEPQLPAEERDPPTALGSIGGVPPGRYDLVIELDGQALPTRSIDIKAREDTVVAVDPP